MYMCVLVSPPHRNGVKIFREVPIVLGENFSLDPPPIPGAFSPVRKTFPIPRRACARFTTFGITFVGRNCYNFF